MKKEKGTGKELVSLVVPFIVFFSLQRYFVRGLLAGSTLSVAVRGDLEHEAERIRDLEMDCFEVISPRAGVRNQ